MPFISYAAMFNGTELTSINGLTVLATNPYKPPKVKLDYFELSRIDKAKVTSAFYRGRNVIVRVGISRKTRDLLEQSIDDLMKILQGREKELILRQSGTNRKYICTLGSVEMDTAGGAYCEMDLVFECSDQFGMQVPLSTILSTGGFTAASRDFALTFGGSAPSQLPIILVTMSLVTGGTTAYMRVRNPQTSKEISVFRNWANGDQLEIDCYNKTVKVNGSSVAFTGSFPEWEPGNRFIRYSDTFTTRSVGMLVTYRPRYV